MPSQKILSAKQAQVASLKEKIAASVAGVVVDYKGINVADDTKLRHDLREAGVEYAVVKNSLLRFAVDGTDYENLKEFFEGTTAVAISKEDPIAAAKILHKFAEDSKGAFTIKAGYMEGKVMSEAEVADLAKLPSKEGLLSMLCSALSGNLRGLAVALNAIAEKKGEEVA